MAADLLQALSLPDAWRGQPCWRVLEIGFASGQQFLGVWQAWRADPQRPRLLHHVVIEPDPVALQTWLENEPIADETDLAALARQLAVRCWGLTPGFHRFAFDDGHVLLTLCIGAVGAMLRAQRFDADSIWLNDEVTRSWFARDAHAGKTLARRCRRGTRLGALSSALPEAARNALRASGFVMAPSPQADAVCATFDPGWTPRRRGVGEPTPLPDGTTSALVIGAGIAGAAVAASLARRGLRVQVLDARPAPAQGTSSLPAGLIAPHLSADDCTRSRLSRAGLRATIEFAQQRLVEGMDWQLSGVLESRADASRVLSNRVDAAHREWSTLASTAQQAAAGLGTATPAVWHAHAGWVRTSALVQALLRDPHIVFRGDTTVHALRTCADGWQTMCADGSVIAQAPLVVLAAGHASAALVGADVLPLQSVRGQLSFGPYAAVSDTTSEAAHQRIALPPFPINGNGSLLPDVCLGDGTRGAVFGATYSRDDAGTDLRAPEHQENLDRLRKLSPNAADWLVTQQSEGDGQGWAGVRAVAPDRLPMVGPVPASSTNRESSERPPLPLWVCTAMGSRGLGQAICCAELLAARLFGEPFAVEPALARAVDARRFMRD